MGYSPWGRKDSDVTERLTLHFSNPEVNIYQQVFVCMHVFTSPEYTPRSGTSGLYLCLTFEEPQKSFQKVCDL